MHYKLITTCAELDDYCNNVGEGDVLAVDTEFVRTRTLTPQLGLIQLYDGTDLVLVDPSQISQFDSLTRLLTNPSVIKVFHSCSEDLEVFLTAFDIVPTPVFDTQIAASLLQMGNSLGYAKLVEEELEIVLDKGESRTDWLARPLSSKQLNYAANDVFYLWKVFPRLYETIKAKGLLHWIYDEVELTAAKKADQIAPENAYIKVKNAWQLSGESLAILQAIAAWRIKIARSNDITLNFIIKETAMFDIAKYKPNSMTQLNRISDLSPHDTRRYGKELVAIVNRICDSEIPQFPPKIRRLVDFPEYKKQCQLLRDICREVAESNKIPVELLGSKKQINQYLTYRWMRKQYEVEHSIPPDLMTCWRDELLNKPFEAVMVNP